jgi:hypothetical protein
VSRVVTRAQQFTSLTQGTSNHEFVLSGTPLPPIYRSSSPNATIEYSSPNALSGANRIQTRTTERFPSSDLAAHSVNSPHNLLSPLNAGVDHFVRPWTALRTAEEIVWSLHLQAKGISGGGGIHNQLGIRPESRYDLMDFPASPEAEMSWR